VARGLRARRFREPETEDVIYRHYRHRKAVEAGLVAIGAAFVATLTAGAGAEAGSKLGSDLLASSGLFLIGFTALFCVHAFKLLDDTFWSKTMFRPIAEWSAALGVSGGFVMCLTALFKFVVLRVV